MAPNSIRGRFGLTDTRNSVHGSGMWLASCVITMSCSYVCYLDSKETALKEIRFFFPDFDPVHWVKKEEPSFRQGNVYYDSHLNIHLPKQS